MGGCATGHEVKGSELIEGWPKSSGERAWSKGLVLSLMSDCKVGLSVWQEKLSSVHFLRQSPMPLKLETSNGPQRHTIRPFCFPVDHLANLIKNLNASNQNIRPFFPF